MAHWGERERGEGLVSCIFQYSRTPYSTCHQEKHACSDICPPVSVQLYFKLQWKAFVSQRNSDYIY